MQNVPATLLGVTGLFVAVAGIQVSSCSTDELCDLPALNESVRWTLRVGVCALALLCLARCILDLSSVKFSWHLHYSGCGQWVLCMECHRTEYRVQQGSCVSAVRPVMSIPALVLSWTGVVAFGISILLAFALHPSSAWGGGLLIFPVLLVAYPVIFSAMLFPSACALGDAVCSCEHDGALYSDAVQAVENASSNLLQRMTRTRLPRAAYEWIGRDSGALPVEDDLDLRIDSSMLDRSLHLETRYVCRRYHQRRLRPIASPLVPPSEADEVVTTK